MGYKNKDRCLAKVDEDEPIFVLRAQDATAVERIRDWLAGAWMGGKLTEEHRLETEQCIQNFVDWQNAHPDRVKWPD